VSLIALTEVILTVLALVAIGVVLRATGLLSFEDARPLNTIIIYVGLPALVFQAVRSADLGIDLVCVALVGWVAVLVGFGVSFAVTRTVKMTRPRAGGFMITSSLGNTGYLGYPLALALFGEVGLVRAIAYDHLATVMAALTIGIAIAQRYGDNGGERTRLLKEIITFPGTIALVLALLARPIPIPDAVSGGLDMLGSLVVPMMMISLGVSLRPAAIGPAFGQLMGVAGIKLLLLPIVAVGVATLLLEDAAAVRLTVLQAGMPSMMLSLVFGIRYRLDVEFVASAILVTTVGALVTVPAFQLVLG
jgi:predicted permease